MLLPYTQARPKMKTASMRNVMPLPGAWVECNIPPAKIEVRGSPPENVIDLDAKWWGLRSFE